MDITQTIFTPEDCAAGVPQRELAEAATTGRASNGRWTCRMKRLLAKTVFSPTPSDGG